jgi:hypothetical protein
MDGERMASMKQELFRIKDYHAALREQTCVLDMSTVIQDCVKNGEYEEAAKYAIDLSNSIYELNNMTLLKHKENRTELLNLLVSVGINVMAVKRNV